MVWMAVNGSFRACGTHGPCLIPVDRERERMKFRVASY
jgi:hypothetical protein